jgi:hypothetical protein
VDYLFIPPVQYLLLFATVPKSAMFVAAFGGAFLIGSANLQRCGYQARPRARLQAIFVGLNSWGAWSGQAKACKESNENSRNLHLEGVETCVFGTCTGLSFG